MAAFLVTGNPGSGKTSLAAELASRGLVAIDPDYDAELSYWEDDAGTKILKVDGPTQPDQRWLRTHHWVWSRSRLQQIVRQHQAPVFVCGIALDIHQVVDLFDRIFLLRIDVVEVNLLYLWSRPQPSFRVAPVEPGRRRKEIWHILHGGSAGHHVRQRGGVQLRRSRSISQYLSTRHEAFSGDPV